MRVHDALTGAKVFVGYTMKKPIVLDSKPVPSDSASGGLRTKMVSHAIIHNAPNPDPATHVQLTSDWSWSVHVP